LVAIHNTNYHDKKEIDARLKRMKPNGLLTGRLYFNPHLISEELKHLWQKKKAMKNNLK
jgi:hypothetical protein